MLNERRKATSGPAIAGPLKWHREGGKHYFARKFVALMPPHLHYVEPYFGGGAVLLAKDPEGVSEVANDLNGDLMNFWRVLRDPCSCQDFAQRCQATPFSEDDWVRAGEILEDSPTWGSLITVPGQEGQCEIIRAWAFFVRCRQSLAGRMNGFATVVRSRVRRGMNDNVSAWLSAVEGLPAVHARLKRVLILNRDALDVIRQQDGPDTLFYLDPPYLHETRATTGEYGEHEMSHNDHFDLLDVLWQIKGKFMLSGYRSSMYDKNAAEHGWRRMDFDCPNQAAGGKEKRRMTECVWMNYDPPGVDA